MTERIPLVLDVDTGIDDSLALLYAAASPDAELLGVTCIGGNVEARQVAENTRAVLELAGRADVPVWLGAEQPLVKRMETAADTHGPLGIGHAELPPPSRALAPGHAADALVELVALRPGRVVLVTLGPLTNLALALEREPRLPHLVAGYVLMGGAYHTSGNTTPTTEWNVYVDPDAAKRTFAAWGAAIAEGAPAPLALGLDVTEQARFLPEHLSQLARAAGAPPATADAYARDPGNLDNAVLRYVADALRFYFEFHQKWDGFYGAFVHDPLAVAAALDRALVQAQRVHVDVEAGPGLAHGMTVADWRGLTAKPPNLDVAVTADSTAFMARLVERVGGLAASRGSVAR